MLFASSAFAQLNHRFRTTVETYNPLGTTATTHRTGGNVDDFPSINGIALPFNFSFDNVSYNQVSFNSNGAVFFGATAPTTYFDFVTSNEGSAFIMGAGADLGSGDVGTIKSEVLGSAPNRIFVVEYGSYQRLNQAATSLNFQIRLHEDSSKIEIHYGTQTSSAGTVFVGLRGHSTADYHTRTSATATDSSWRTSTRSQTVTGQMPLTDVAFPVTGTKYIFTPPPPATNDLSLTRLTGIPSGALCDSTSISFNVLIRNAGTAELTPTLLAQVIRDNVVVNTIPYTGTALAGVLLKMLVSQVLIFKAEVTILFVLLI